MALEWLTGRVPQTSHVTDLSAADLTALATAPKTPTLIGTIPTRRGTMPKRRRQRLRALAARYDVELTTPHAFVLRDVDANGDLILHNPWQKAHPRPLPHAVVTRLFGPIAWCHL